MSISLKNHDQDITKFFFSFTFFVNKFYPIQEIKTRISKECNFEKIFKEIRPSSILIKGRQVDVKDQYIATLATSKSSIPTAIPSTMKITLCPLYVLLLNIFC